MKHGGVIHVLPPPVSLKNAVEELNLFPTRILPAGETYHALLDTHWYIGQLEYGNHTTLNVQNLGTRDVQ